MKKITKIKHLLSGAMLALLSLTGQTAEVTSTLATAPVAPEPKVYFIHNDHLGTPTHGDGQHQQGGVAK